MSKGGRRGAGGAGDGDPRLPPMPAAGRVARGRRRRSAPALPRRGLLGEAARRVRRPGGAGGDRRPGARRPRRQPHRPHVHRRPLRRLALRGAAPGRATPTRPQSEHRGDGLRLRDAYVTAVVRCAPPANKPTTGERDNCLPYLERELELLERCRVVVALGSFGWDGVLRAARALGVEVPRPKPRFGHGAEADLGRWTLLGCFHPSQQNTFTGKLTVPMIDAVFARAAALSR